MNEYNVQKLNQLIRDNQDKYYRIAYGYMKNKDDSLDALQNTIVIAIQNCPQLRNVHYMDTWFCRILINECLRLLKKKKIELSFEDIENHVQSFRYDNQEVEIKRQELYKAINKLDDHFKTIIQLRYFNGMKIEEIAKITNTNLSTTKSRLYKALSLLRKEMEENHEDK